MLLLCIDGWCSHAMDLFKGDLNLIRAERVKKVPNDHFIADIGIGIEKLMDTFEIAARLDELSPGPLTYGAKLRGNSKEDELYTLGEKYRCFFTALVHPESAALMAPEQNGDGHAKPSVSPSIFHHVVPPCEDSVLWQLFFDTLVQSYEQGAYFIQENIETYSGFILSSHLPDLYRTMYYITHGEGKFLYAALRKKSMLYNENVFTCERATDEGVNDDTSRNEKVGNAKDSGDSESIPRQKKIIQIDTSSFERRPHNTSDENYLNMISTRCAELTLYLQEILIGHNAYTRDSVMEFLDIIKDFPVPIKYITLHYMVADGMFFITESRSDYFDWMIQAFISTRFFVALAAISEGDYSDMMKMIGGDMSAAMSKGDNSIPATIVGGKIYIFSIFPA